MRSYDSAPRPPLPLSLSSASSLSFSVFLCVAGREMGGWSGRGAKSYHREKARASINHSILSALYQCCGRGSGGREDLATTSYYLSFPIPPSFLSPPPPPTSPPPPPPLHLPPAPLQEKISIRTQTNQLPSWCKGQASTFQKRKKTQATKSVISCLTYRRNSKFFLY